MPLGRRLQKGSQRGEAETAEDLGGEKQHRSGAGTFRKADVKSEAWLVERKDTTSKQYALKRADLLKLRQQATQEDRFGVFQVAFGDDSYAVVSWPLFLEMHEVYASSLKEE